MVRFQTMQNHPELFNNTDSYAAAGQNFQFYFPEAGGPMEWIIWDVNWTMVTQTLPPVFTFQQVDIQSNKFENNERKEINEK